MTENIITVIPLYNGGWAGIQTRPTRATLLGYGWQVIDEIPLRLT
jgi:hypothetical protein